MMTDLTEKTLAIERKYTGKIIRVDLLDIELSGGRKAKRAANDMQDYRKRKTDFPMITQPLHLNPNKGDRPLGALWTR